MGVIGRLDDQVNELIIKPVGAGKRQEGDEQTRDDSQKTAPPQAEARENRAQNEEHVKARSESELPVWLL
ncbi:MAG TPA: hypothetical protein VGC66_04005 [Pyrinomonadaceae bacterium]|jgi:hypothetical protein